MTDPAKAAEVFPPSEFVRDELEARGWGCADLASMGCMAIEDARSLVTGGRITDRLAARLGVAFGTSADLWLNLQRAYDKRRQ